MLKAVRDIATRDGMGHLSARHVAEEADVGASTVSAKFSGMFKLRAKLIEAAFGPLIHAFELADNNAGLSAFEIATAPLRAEASLPVLVTQVAAYIGLRDGEQRAFALLLDRSWRIARDHIASFEIPNSQLRHFDDAGAVADRIMSWYFAAALQLARNPNVTPDQLQKIVRGP
ncbi:hypothetical protein ABC969_10010 [Sphingomonas qilianensis]|uniref:HTH tetR-type domain-containing protein n=1 Tax=Sphingomonas qilianensis TaxID=1736690 RepID=A0ABU9XTD0_9SPHN